MSTGAQNMKMGPVALSTAEKEFGSAELENGSRRPRYRGKRLREPTRSLLPKTSPGAQNMKTGPDPLGTIENEHGRAKFENGTRLPRNRRKRVRERKT
jgi:hypothetical protein